MTFQSTKIYSQRSNAYDQTLPGHALQKSSDSYATAWLSFRQPNQNMAILLYTVELGYKHSPGLKHSMLTTRLFL